MGVGGEMFVEKRHKKSKKIIDWLALKAQLAVCDYVMFQFCKL